MRQMLDLSDECLTLTPASLCRSLLQCSTPRELNRPTGVDPRLDPFQPSRPDYTAVRFMLEYLARDLTALDEPPSAQVCFFWWRRTMPFEPRVALAVTGRAHGLMAEAFQ